MTADEHLGDAPRGRRAGGAAKNVPAGTSSYPGEDAARSPAPTPAAPTRAAPTPAAPTRAAPTPAAPTQAAPTDASTPIEAEKAPSALEVRYRRLLRLLPRPYRAQRADEMVATFLAAAHDADPENWDLAQRYDSPDWAEKRSIVALALRLRWADPTGPQRARVRFEGVRRALFAYLVLTAAAAITALIARAGIAWWPPTDGAPAATVVPLPPDEHAWVIVENWSFVAWIPALWCGLRGGRAALWCAVGLAALPTTIAVATAVAIPSGPARTATYVVPALLDVVAVAALIAVAAARSSLAVPHARRWLTAAGCAVAALAAVQVLTVIGWHAGWLPRGDAGDAPLWLLPIGWLVVDDVGLWCWAALAVGVVLAIRARRGGVLPEAVLGLALFAAAVLALRVGSGWVWLSAVWPGHAVTTSRFASALLAGSAAGIIVQIALTATIFVISVTAAARRFRALPAAEYAASR